MMCAVIDPVTLQRKIKRWYVRIQSRMEAGIADRWIPAFSSALLTVLVARFALFNFERLQTGPDVSRYGQAINLIAEGKSSSSSLLNVEVEILQLHFSFILYPLGLVSHLIEPIPMLLMLQAIAIGSALIPLWIFARHVAKLRIAASSAVLAAYSFHPMTHELATEDFHPETLALPVLISMAYFGATKKWPAYWVCVILVLLIRADLGLLVAFWGFVLIRDDDDKQGMRTLSLGFAWSLGILLIVQPLLGMEAFTWSDNLFVRENSELFVSLLAPLIFLPLLSMKHFFPALPLAAYYLISSGEIDYGDPRPFLLAFAMVATTYAFHRLGKLGVNRVFTDPWLLGAFTAAFLLIFISVSPLSPYERPWNWGERNEVAISIVEAAEQVPENVAIRASVSALPELIEREFIYELKGDVQPTAVAATANNVEAVLIVERDLMQRSIDSRNAFDSQIAIQGFELVYDKSGVLLYSEG